MAHFGRVPGSRRMIRTSEGPVSLKVIAKCISADFAFFFTKYFKGHLGKFLIFQIIELHNLSNPFEIYFVLMGGKSSFNKAYFKTGKLRACYVNNSLCGPWAK